MKYFCLRQVLQLGVKTEFLDYKCPKVRATYYVNIRQLFRWSSLEGFLVVSPQGHLLQPAHLHHMVCAQQQHWLQRHDLRGLEKLLSRISRAAVSLTHRALHRVSSNLQQRGRVVFCVCVYEQETLG